MRGRIFGRGRGRGAGGGGRTGAGRGLGRGRGADGGSGYCVCPKRGARAVDDIHRLWRRLGELWPGLRPPVLGVLDGRADSAAGAAHREVLPIR